VVIRKAVVLALFAALLGCGGDDAAGDAWGQGADVVALEQVLADVEEIFG
jgi:hypothetical protein